jgi:uroporphyrinogen decarboxylase
MNSRERVMTSLRFGTPDRVPKDLGGMRSTGISAFAYPKLVKALGLPPRRPRVYDTWQMLALPEIDVLDALGADVVTVHGAVTNAFDQPELWHAYDFNGRLPALVRDPSGFSAAPDGTILQGPGRMPPQAHVFDEEHAGQPLVLEGDLPKPDLDEIRKGLAKRELTDENVREMVILCRRIRENTSRAVFLDYWPAIPDISLGSHGGLGVLPLLCLTDPDYVRELHQLGTDHVLLNLSRLLPDISPYIDIIMTGADDWGMQSGLLSSPETYRELFKPFYSQVNDRCHRLAPQVKTFMHNCGAIYDLLDDIVDSGFDILNPVQWSAGGHSPLEWKQRAGKRLAFWGGGVNSQVTLPRGSVAEVESEVKSVVPLLASGGGYVFCNIHNILAEIEPEKVMTMYRTAGSIT